MAMNELYGKLEIAWEPISALFLENECIMGFRDPDTMRGGRITIRRDDEGLLIVAFEDLDPGVNPTAVVADPVEAGNAVAILELTMEWLNNLKAVTLPAAWDTARPLGFDGIPTLEKLAQQLKQEGDR